MVGARIAQLEDSARKEVEILGMLSEYDASVGSTVLRRELRKGNGIMKLGKRDIRIIETLVKVFREHFGADYKKSCEHKVP